MAASGLRFVSLSSAYASITLGFDRTSREQAPGSEWQYGAGHDVLARLIEIFTGAKYEDFLEANVRQLFTPLQHICHCGLCPDVVGPEQQQHAAVHPGNRYSPHVG